MRPLDATEEVVLALHRGARITGRVVDAATALPVDGARVRWFPRAERIDLGEPREHAGAREDATDADGRFEIGDVPAGEARLGVAADGYAACADGPFAVDAGTIERRILLTRGGSVAGALLDLDGAPLAGEAVVVAPLRSSADDVRTPLVRSRETTTDADGRFRIAGLPAGRYQVSHRHHANAAGETYYAERRLVEISDGAEVAVELQPLGSARVRGSLRAEVELPREVPVSIQAIVAPPLDLAELARRSSGVLAVDGAFELAGLEPGEYSASVFLRLDGLRLQGSARFTVAPGGIADVVIALEGR